MTTDPRDYKSVTLHKFLAPCEHRQTQPNLCMLQSSKVGFLCAADTLTCARCQLTGRINEEYINKLAFDALKKHMNLALLGFHEPSDVVPIFKRAFSLIMITQDRIAFDKMLLACLAHKRITEEEVVSLTKELDITIPTADLEAALGSGMPIPAPKEVTPKRECCGEKKEMGLLEKVAVAATGAVKATVAVMGLSEEASPEVQLARYETCRTCSAIDSEGLRLYRFEDGKLTCGKPAMDKILRNPKIEGCGCSLDVKIPVKSEQCPLGKWKE